jgi:acyl dehydratase
MSMQDAPILADAQAVHARVGQELFVSHWVTLDQERIDRFADATGDHQWIHVDVERAQRESPFGTTIAHGFLTLSLLAHFYEGFMARSMPFCGMGLNYGLDRVRFTAPVRSGRRVRGRFMLARASDLPDGLQLHFTVTVEIEGEDRPALVAESIVRRQFRSAATPSGAKD